MKRGRQIRRRRGMVLAMAAVFAISCASAHAQRYFGWRVARRMQVIPVGVYMQQGRFPEQRPAPIIRRPPPQGFRNGSPEEFGRGGFHPHGEHLSQWMAAHSNLTPQQQQEALGREPGFNALPPDVQQRMRQRLAQLDAMRPEARARMLDHMELMERLEPAQRTAVRNAMHTWAALPEPDRSIVGQAFRETRGMPPEERLAILNARYRNLDPQARQALQQLMDVEPLLPPPGQP